MKSKTIVERYSRLLYRLNVRSKLLMVRSYIQIQKNVNCLNINNRKILNMIFFNFWGALKTRRSTKLNRIFGGKFVPKSA